MISDGDAQALLDTKDLIAIGMRADEVRRRQPVPVSTAESLCGGMLSTTILPSR